MKHTEGVEIEVKEGVASFTKAGDLISHHVGEEIAANFLDENSWERVPTPHKYADVIKAWADGHEVQYSSFFGSEWHDAKEPDFTTNLNWRIKPDRILEIENTITELQNELEELKRS